MIYTIITVAALSLGMSAGAAQASSVDRYLGAAYEADKTNPCKGSVSVRWAYDLRDDLGRSMAGLASGIEVMPGGAWMLRWCEITLDLDDWRHGTRGYRCRLVYHEYKHLGFHRHTVSGVMSPDPLTMEDAPMPQCDELVRSMMPLDERMVDAVLARVPTGWAVSCGRVRHRVARCMAENDEIGSRRRVRRYVVHVAGKQLEGHKEVNRMPEHNQVHVPNDLLKNTVVRHDVTGATGIVIQGGDRPRVQWKLNGRITRVDVKEITVIKS